MDIAIQASSLPHDDPDASLAFSRDTLGFEVRGDVGRGRMRWITVGPAGQPGTSILLAPPAADPGITDDERRTIAEMMAKGTYGWILLATKDLDGTFERVRASGADVVQEPTLGVVDLDAAAERAPRLGRRPRGGRGARRRHRQEGTRLGEGHRRGRDRGLTGPVRRPTSCAG
jgi:hypothetical protein